MMAIIELETLALNKKLLFNDETVEFIYGVDVNDPLLKRFFLQDMVAAELVSNADNQSNDVCVTLKDQQHMTLSCLNEAQAKGLYDNFQHILHPKQHAKDDVLEFNLDLDK